MIFPIPIVIGAVVGAALAYASKDKKIKEWLSDKSSIGIFKKDTHYEEEMEESIEGVEETKWLDKGKDNTLKITTEKLKKTAESIKGKTSEVIGDTTVRVKETVKWIKEKTPEVLEATTIKVKKMVEWGRKKTTEIFKNTVVKVKETGTFKDATIKAKETVELAQEKSGKVLENVIQKIKRAFEPVNKRYK